jgi:hypothetical protein
MVDPKDGDIYAVHFQELLSELPTSSGNGAGAMGCERNHGRNRVQFEQAHGSIWQPKFVTQIMTGSTFLGSMQRAYFGSGFPEKLD